MPAAATVPDPALHGMSSYSGGTNCIGNCNFSALMLQILYGMHPRLSRPEEELVIYKVYLGETVSSW